MGAKKKKSLANRLAKMSDDERARYLQHRADMEEEARRRKEQLISTFLKNKIKKEDGFARLNAAKINSEWHQILRKIKCKEMKEEVEHIKRYIERVVENKNNTIDKLMQELAEAEEHYIMNFQSHLVNINKMIEFSYKSVEEMDKIFDEDRSTLIETWNVERNDYLSKALEDRVYLKTVIFQQENMGKQILRSEYEDYFKRSDDVIRENKKEFDEMRRSRESVINDIWRQIAALLHSHVEHTDKKRAHLAELQSLDAENASEIIINEENIQRQEEEISKLEERVENFKKYREEEIKSSRQEVENLKKNSLIIKIKHKKALDLDEKQLLYLTNKSNQIIRFLEDIYKKGEKILNLAQICRKFETQKEKIYRFQNPEDNISLFGDDSFRSDDDNDKDKVNDLHTRNYLKWKEDFYNNENVNCSTKRLEEDMNIYFKYLSMEKTKYKSNGEASETVMSDHQLKNQELFIYKSNSDDEENAINGNSQLSDKEDEYYGSLEDEECSVEKHEYISTSHSSDTSISKSQESSKINCEILFPETPKIPPEIGPIGVSACQSLDDSNSIFSDVSSKSETCSLEQNKKATNNEIFPCKTNPAFLGAAHDKYEFKLRSRSTSSLGEDKLILDQITEMQDNDRSLIKTKGKNFIIKEESGARPKISKYLQLGKSLQMQPKLSTQTLTLLPIKSKSASLSNRSFTSLTASSSIKKPEVQKRSKSCYTSKKKLSSSSSSSNLHNSSQFTEGTKFFENISKVESVWINYNKVLINCKQMRKELKQLEEENQRMKQEIRKLLEVNAIEQIKTKEMVKVENVYKKYVHKEFVGQLGVIESKMLNKMKINVVW